MATTPRVLVAGPTGTLGSHVIPHLLKAGFSVSLLTRNAEKTAASFPDVKSIIETDFVSADSVVSALKGEKYDSLVILTNRDEVDAQIMLMDAAVAVGIPHIVPSAFGLPTTSKNRTYPVFKDKARMEEHLHAKAKEGHFTYTAIHPGIFLDWYFGRGMAYSLDPDRATMIFNGGEALGCATTLDNIGKAVASAVLQRHKFPNQELFICNAMYSQNKILQYAKDAVPGREFKTLDLDVEVLVKQAEEKIRNGESGTEVVRPYLARAWFKNEEGRFDRNDNDKLGIERWSEDKLKQFVADDVHRKLR